LTNAGNIKVLLNGYNRERDEIQDLSKSLETGDAQLVALKTELKEVLDSVTICPLNLRPISEECKKGMNDAEEPA